jgi:2-polyprenyl-6-methoxyphenol hydroxylase-like FAD-dependent oxidoreductase
MRAAWLRLLSQAALMSQRIDTEVLIVGAGPVGLTLAIDLAHRGVDVTLVEMRHAGEPPKVSCNHVSAGTMETFRRIGIASAVRNAGLPADYPNDVAFRTTAIGIEMARIRIPCRANRYTAKGGPDTWWPTPEPPHRINQIYLEPMLFACATEMQRLRTLSRTRVSDFEQDAHGVMAVAKDLNSNKSFQIFARYLVGCDGAHSDVRHGIGVRLSRDSGRRAIKPTFSRPACLRSCQTEHGLLIVSIRDPGV